MLIFFAQCVDGIGSNTFLPYFKHESAQKIGEKLASEFQINGQTALSLRDLAERINIIFISDLEASIIRQIGMTPCRTWEEATKFISEKLGDFQRGVVISEAATTVPL